MSIAYFFDRSIPKIVRTSYYKFYITPLNIYNSSYWGTVMARQDFWIASVLFILILFHVFPTSPGIDAEFVPQETKITRGTIVVNASGGGDYTHIQWAIDNASEGDTVYVEAGTYDETIEIDKSISLTGESLETTTMTGEGRIVNISADGVNVSGFTVTGSTVPYEGVGIFLENVRDCNISGNDCSDNSYCGIQVANCTQVIISKNKCCWIGVEKMIIPYPGDGIFVNNSQEIIITNNVCSNNTYNGINIENTDCSIIDNNICNNHDEYYIDGIGILFYRSSNNTIMSNRCIRNAEGLTLIESDNNDIFDNYFHKNWNFGLRLFYSNNNNVKKNKCNNTWGTGFSLSSSSNNILFGNQIIGNSFGLFISTSKHIIIYSNSIEGNGDGICLYNNSKFCNIICNNLVDNGLYFYDREDEGFAINLDFWDDKSPPFNNRIHHNNFFNNSISHKSQARDSNVSSSWNNSLREGNYWLDYLTRYPDAENYENVWNQPYELEGDNPSSDFFPLVYPVEQGTYYPVAIVDSPLEIDQHETITFDGNLCYDHLGIANYTWDFDDNGNHIHLFGISPKYTFHEAGTYIVSLAVTNTQGNRDRANSVITVRDIEPPVANAGPDAAIELNKAHQFDGSASRDNVGIVNYTWHGAGWRELYGVAPSFTFDIPGKFHVTLRVVDANGNFDEDKLVLTAWDATRPTAIAGYDMFVDQHEMMVFNGSGSTDNHGIADYTWRFNDGDTNVILNGETCLFVFHNAGKYDIMLNVSDDEGNWDTDNLTVNVRDVTPPVADAGFNTTVFQDTIVTFDGTKSTDYTGIVNYTWSFTYAHNEKTLHGPIPNFFFGRPGLYKITLKVWDALFFSDTDQIWVKVLDNEKPVADAGNNTTIYLKDTLRFDGRNSSDNVGIVNYTWILEHDGKSIELYGPYPDFRFMEIGIYTITLMAKDQKGNVGEDTINVTVIELPETMGGDDDEKNFDMGDKDPEEDPERVAEGFESEILIRIGVLMGIFVVAVLGLLLYFFRKKDKEPAGQGSEDEMGRVGNDDRDDNDG